MIRETSSQRVAIYLRVSTREQTTANQRIELESWAKRQGHELVASYEESGVSGAKWRDKRPQLGAMLRAATRREFDVLAVWSVDRLGRSLGDLLKTLHELHAVGVELVLHQQGLDTRTAGGRALFQMLGVFAEFERAILIERTRAGLARARREGKRLGRPMLSLELRNKIRAKHCQGCSQSSIARQLKISRFAVQAELRRLRSELPKASWAARM